MTIDEAKATFHITIPFHNRDDMGTVYKVTIKREDFVKMYKKWIDEAKGGRRMTREEEIKKEIADGRR